MGPKKLSSPEDASSPRPTLKFGHKAYPNSSTLPLHNNFTIRASNSWKRVILAVSSLALLSLVIYRAPPSCLSLSHSPISRPPAYLITADRGAVATENKRCSDIGVSVLEGGGNAVDAAISATLCVGVVNMFSAGIGGGGYMTVRIPPKVPGGSSEVFTVNYREVAPERAIKTMYVNDSSASKYGGLSVGVPGELRGFAEAHRRWGRLPWHRLVRPSAELAKEWSVDVELAGRIQRYADLMLYNKDWSVVFAPEGRLLLQGDTIRRTNYSRTLDIIANEGAGAFYKGPVAGSIVRKINETGGILTHADLEKYTVKVEHALTGTYRDKKVYTSHAPTSGPVLLHMLNLLERYNLISEGRTSLNLHRVVEAMKFGFAARTRIGDLDFYPGDKNHVLEISSKEFADSIAAKLTDDRTHPAEYYNPEYDIEIDHGTTQISVVDKDGLAVSLTSTVNSVFGSQVLDPETGVILNDQMADFSTPGISTVFGLRPSPYNYPEPGKRPLSSIVPTILENADGSLYVAVGGSGGVRIIPAVLQTLLNLDWGMDVSQAVEYGRLHDQLYPEQVDVDSILPAQVLDSLRSRGHNATILDITDIDCLGCLPGIVQAVVKKDGKLYAASDSRKNGIAAGY